MNSCVITSIEINGTKQRVSALLDEKRKLLEAQPEVPGAVSVLGNIYVGRVQNVVKNLNAAFIQIAPDTVCYYPLEDYKNPVFTRRLSGKKMLVAGDELLVQVKKEALKTKEATVTTNISLPGKYVVLTTENTRFGVSGKLDALTRARVTELLSDFRSEEYGLIVRTNARNAADEAIRGEAEALAEEYAELLQRASHSTCFCCLKQEEPGYLRKLKDLREDQLAEIITDDREIYERICRFYGIPEEQLFSKGSVSVPLDEQTTDSGISIRFYHDSQISLGNLYSLKHQLEEALRERVWLKSGAYLIIQPTEALTVIDVNTGKNTAKKETQEQFLAVNLEAAAEIARQLRLRNLSGIIVVDFINLKSEEAKKRLLEDFSRMLKEDPVQTALVDITALGLVEITRKKIRKSLAESLR
ncbi:MAG: ribonuclease E/G [Roseburia sp.]